MRISRYNLGTIRLLAGGMKGTEIAVKAANTVENATKKVDNEVARESRRQAESQGGTTIVMGTTVPRPPLWCFHA